MDKPVPWPRAPIMVYSEMIRYIEAKYGLKVRGYKGIGKANAEEHFDRYCRETGDVQPNDGHYPDLSAVTSRHSGGHTVVRNGKRRPATRAEYDADFKLIHDHYDRYRWWCVSNPEPEYRDYWHWLLGNVFTNVNNPCTQYFPIREILEDEDVFKDVPEWVKEITQLLHVEFLEHLDDAGGLEVEIAW